MKDAAPAAGRRRPDFRRALRALLARRRALLRGHPAAPVIVAYHRRRLTAGGADRLRAHLALCSECGDLVLALAALPDPRPREPP